MLQDGLRHFSNISLIVFGMLLFLTAFVSVLIQLIRNPKHYHEVSQLPLTEENNHHE